MSSSARAFILLARRDSSDLSEKNSLSVACSFLMFSSSRWINAY